MIDINEYKNKLVEIDKKVYDVLAKQVHHVEVIRSKERFVEYINECNKQGIIAIDTETSNSTDVVNKKYCILMGLCLYSPGLKQAYIPVNHKDIDSDKRLTDQLCEDDIKEALEMIDPKTVILMHNGKFDYKVLKVNCSIDIKPTWDTMIAAKLLNENESASLKEQYTTKIDPTQEKYDIDKLFKGVEYAYVNPDTFSLYAATDSMMTYKLYELQKQEFSLETNKQLFKLFKEVEMPVVTITGDMELRGISVDTKFAASLKDKYHKRLVQVDLEINNLLKILKPYIEDWKHSSDAQKRVYVYESESNIEKPLSVRVKNYPYIDPLNERRYKLGKKAIDVLTNPINLNSPSQRAVLIYDILGASSGNKENTRSVGAKDLQKTATNIKSYWDDIQKNLIKLSENEEDILYESFDEELKYDDEELIDTNRLCLINPNVAQLTINLCVLLSSRQGLNKLISSYLDNIPGLVKHWGDGLIRFNFNSIGTATGRFSSGGKFHYFEDGEAKSIQSLNMQNIPSKNHEIRLMFKAPKGRKLVGGDFSQQEAKLTSYLSRDPKLLEAIDKGLDLYSTFAQGLFNNEYEDNLEYYEPGHVLEYEGKKVICGYKTHKNVEGKERRKKAKTLFLAVGYGMGVKSFAEQIRDANEKAGEDKDDPRSMYNSFFIMYPKVRQAIDNAINSCKKRGYVEDIYGRRRRLPKVCLPPFNIFYVDNPYINQNKPDAKIKEYINKLNDLKGDEPTKEAINQIMNEAKNERIVIKSNEKTIRDEERKCFNSMIQGSAATLTKYTMVRIANDPVLKELDAHLILQVHDEVILDCPEENSDKVEARLKDIMCNSSYDLELPISFSCDTAVENHWGEEEMSTDLRKEYNDLVKKMSHNEAVSKIQDKYPEFDETSINKLVSSDKGSIEI